MIELTPLDVRKKKGDFRRGLRGYEPQQVDDFLDVVADRLEAVVRDAASMHERVSRLEQQVADYRDREKALTEALVSAQQMREDMRTQSTREVELIRKQAEQEAESIKADAVKARDREEEALRQLRTRQIQFLASYRTFLEQELADLQSMTRALEVYGSGVAATAPRAAPAPGPAPVPATGKDPTSGTPGPGHGAPPSMAAAPTAAPASPPWSASPAATAPAPPTPKAPAGAATTKQETTAFAPAASAIAPPARAPERETIGQPSPGVPPEPVAASPPRASPPARGGSSDELEAQLEKALARWEPELEQTPAEAARAGTDLDDEEDEIELDESPDALADELEFLLSDDDMVGGAGQAESEPRPVAQRKEPKHPPQTMRESDDLEAELAELLAEEDEEDDFEIELEDVPELPVAASPADEPDDDVRDEVTTAMSDSGNESMIDLDDAFGEPPPDGGDVEREPTFDELLKAATRPDETGDAAGPGEDSHLATYGMSEFDPQRGAGGEGDTSGLTLHPMFFDQDSPDLPGLLHPSEEKRKEDRHDRWSASGDEE
jgi:DivIVA domain-containing protein